MRAPIFEKFLNETGYEWHFIEEEEKYSVHSKVDKSSWIQVKGYDCRFTTGEPTPEDLVYVNIYAGQNSAMGKLRREFPKGIHASDIPKLLDYMKDRDLFSDMIRWRLGAGI